MLEPLQDYQPTWFSISHPFFLGSRYQRDIPGKQEGGWPSEDIHHLQQGQGLAPTASSRYGPERKPGTLPAGQSPRLMWSPHGRLLTWGPVSGDFFHQGVGGGLRNLAGAGQGFPTSPRALIYGRRLPFLLDGKFSSIPQTFTENIACAPTPSKMRKCTRESACVSGSQAELSCGNTLVNWDWYDAVWWVLDRRQGEQKLPWIIRKVKVVYPHRTVNLSAFSWFQPYGILG